MSLRFPFFYLILAFFYCNGFSSFAIPTEYRTKFSQMASIRSAFPLSNGGEARSGRRVFYPVEYGADPNGKGDSSGAFLNAIKDAFEMQNGHELLHGISDMGGVQIDLQGGNYVINSPLRFPPQGGGNVLIHGGTLRASDDFPADRYLMELQSSSSTVASQGITTKDHNLTVMEVGNTGIIYEDITFRDLLFDSNFMGGGISIINSVRIRITNCYFIHFTTQGVLIKGGHETYISSSFLGQHETIGGDPMERNFSGVAIDMSSNDNAITDVVIFSAKIGIILRGQANMITGVHCYNKATYWGGIGILLELPGLSQTRIDNCYMDYTSIVVQDPVQVHITNTFFLGDANVVLKSMKGKISGINIIGNMFSGSGKSKPIVELDESNGKFLMIDQVVIDQNNVEGMQMKSTISKRTVSGKGTKWVSDFSSELIFPNQINHFQYSFYPRDQTAFPLHSVTKVSNNMIVVESKEEVDAVVSIMVDQYTLPGEGRQFT